MYIGLHIKYPLFLSDLVKIYFSRQIFKKYSNINCHENRSNGSRVVPCTQTDGRTDMKKVIITFPNFANASKNNEDRNIINVQRSSCRVFVI